MKDECDEDGSLLVDVEVPLDGLRDEDGGLPVDVEAPLDGLCDEGPETLEAEDGVALLEDVDFLVVVVYFEVSVIVEGDEDGGLPVDVEVPLDVSCDEGLETLESEDGVSLLEDVDVAVPVVDVEGTVIVEGDEDGSLPVDDEVPLDEEGLETLEGNDFVGLREGVEVSVPVVDVEVTVLVECDDGGGPVEDVKLFVGVSCDEVLLGIEDGGIGRFEDVPVPLEVSRDEVSVTVGENEEVGLRDGVPVKLVPLDVG